MTIRRMRDGQTKTVAGEEDEEEGMLEKQIPEKEKVWEREEAMGGRDNLRACNFIWSHRRH